MSIAVQEKVLDFKSKIGKGWEKKSHGGKDTWSESQEEVREGNPYSSNMFQIRRC